jgi:hypothetical protein
VGRLSDHWGSLQKAVLILPGALLVGGLLWLALAFKTRRACRQPPANQSARTSG